MRSSLLASAGLAFFASPASGRPYTVDDMLHAQSYGEVTMQPGGSHNLIIERRSSYDEAPGFPFGFFSARLTSHIFIENLLSDTHPRSLFQQDRQAGYWTGGFSPSGRFLIVYRLDLRSCRMGVYDMRTGALRWLPGTPLLSVVDPDPVWLDDNRFASLMRTDDRLPSLLTLNNEAQTDLIKHWAMTNDGSGPGVTLVDDRTLGDPHSMPVTALSVTSVRDGSQSLLTSGALVDVSASADGKMLAVTRIHQNLASGAITPSQMGMPVDQHDVVLIDVATGKSINPCPDCDVLYTSLRWSKIGAHLLFYARSNTNRWSDGRLYVVNRFELARDPLPQGFRLHIEKPADDAPKIDAAWIGDQLAIAGFIDDKQCVWQVLDTTRISFGLKTSARCALLVSADATSLLLQDGNRLREQRIDGTTSWSPPGSLERDAFNDDFRLGQRGAATRPVVALRSTNNRSDLIQQIVAGHVDPAGFPVSGKAQILAFDDAAALVIVRSTDPHGEVSLAAIDHRGRRLLLDSLNGDLADVDLAPAQALPHGLNCDWLFLPPSGDRAIRHPLIVLPYPEDVYSCSTPPDTTPGRFRPVQDIQLLAAQGYAVLVPSIPLRRDDHEPAKSMRQPFEEALDHVLATKVVDSGRIAVWGQSYGGYTALLLAGQSARIRAVIASASLSNLLTDYGAFPKPTEVTLNDGLNQGRAFGWAEKGQGRMGAPPWDVPDRYVANSPFFYARRISAPVLLIHGDMDFIPVGEAEQMFSALYHLGKDAQLLRYWGESHEPYAAPNVKDLYLRVFEWLRVKLATSVRPTDSTTSATRRAPKLPS